MERGKGRVRDRGVAENGMVGDLNHPTTAPGYRRGRKAAVLKCDYGHKGEPRLPTCPVVLAKRTGRIRKAREVSLTELYPGFYEKNGNCRLYNLVTSSLRDVTKS